MKKTISLLLVLVMVFAIMLTGCAPKTEPAAAAPAAAPTEAPKAEPLKVGFVYIGSANDGGYTQAHDEGRLYLEQQLGDKIVTMFKEGVPESSEAEKVMNDLIDQGCTVIFANSFGHMDFVEKAAKAHPDIKFYHASGYKSGPNFTNYFGAMEQARYLAGIVAGLRTENNKLGYVAAFEIPEVVRGINAYTLGAQSVNKDITVKVNWTHTWYDPAKEKEAAKALLDAGCDVLAQHQDTTATQQAAEEKGVWAIGYDLDTRASAPKAYLTAPVWHWGKYYAAEVQRILDGNWKQENYYGDMKDGMIDLAPLTENAAEGSQAAVDKAKAAIIDGSLNVFAGPLKDQTGAVKIPEGSAMTFEQMMSVDWFVQGVEGKIK
ncbi:MAG TPA: BMP family ABC transporter substrate-binding protein [Clostridia bacterium]|nr:BMP family ABC transporter substrate-binding protein [Clostridia bacterium]